PRPGPGRRLTVGGAEALREPGGMVEERLTRRPRPRADPAVDGVGHRDQSAPAEKPADLEERQHALDPVIADGHQVVGPMAEALLHRALPGEQVRRAAARRRANAGVPLDALAGEGPDLEGHQRASRRMRTMRWAALPSQSSGDRKSVV